MAPLVLPPTGICAACMVDTVVCMVVESPQPMTGPRTEAFERLSLDGGWLTAAALSMECGQSENTIATNLHRQVRAGWVQKRIVYLAVDLNVGYRGARDRRVEFRVVVE